MSTSAQERRKYNRVSSSLKLRYQVLEIPMRKGMKEAKIIDISAGGVAFIYDGQIDKDDILKIEINIPDYHKSFPQRQVFGPVTSVARVVRQWRNINGEECIAVKFIDIYTKHQEDILEYVLRKLKRNK